MIQLTGQFDEALALARECHEGPCRKGTGIPYISHPMGVASLVLEFGGTQDEAIAALLHDVLEDGGAEWASEIETRFGGEVLRVVQQCSDAVPAAGEAKPPWKERKTKYIASLEHKSQSALLVTCCDKLHNLSAIVRDYRQHGDALWDRFNSDADDIRWYYSEMTNRLLERDVRPARELAVRLSELSGMLENSRKP